MKKILKALTLTALLLTLFSLTAFAVSFPDVPRDGSERANAIYKLADNGIVGGYEDGCFRPDNYLTRAELCKIVNLVFGYNEPDTSNFKDVKTTDWFYSYVLVAKKAGYIKGFEDETFRGSEKLTREQTCIIVSRTAGLYDLPTSTVVKDKISDWAKADVMKVIANFVMSPDKNGNFRATENITRAELAMALDAFVKEKPAEPSNPSVGPSLPIGPSGPTVTSYTVKFYDADGKVISTQTVTQGSSATAPSAPSKASDKEYSYTFKGWSKIYTVVYSNLDIYPEYNKTLLKYTVKLSYGDGTTGTMPESVEAGYKETLLPLLPSDGFTNGNKYFAGWYAGDNLIDTETYADLTTDTLTAKWVTRFTVNFYDAEGKVLKTQTVKYGENATAPASPTKSADNENTYTFKSWDKSYKNVTSNLDVYPTYTAKPKIYTVKLSYGSGVTGTMPEKASVTYKEALSSVLPSAGFKKEGFAFDGWYAGDNLIDTETYADLTTDTLTAKWTELFTVKFYNAKDEVIKTESVRRGESATAPASPTKSATNEYTYTFKAWDKSFSSVKENLDVRPTYTETVRTYPVTLDYGTGKKETVNATFNQKISELLPSSMPQNGTKYFAGWYIGNELIDTETYADLTANTLVARWVDTFTVKFYNSKDEVIKTETVNYGKSATAPSAPSKAESDEYTYTFAGWDTSFTSVTSNLDVKPTYNKTLRKYAITLDYGTGKKETVYSAFNQALSEVLPSSLPQNGLKHFIGWYVGNELIDDEIYSDLKPSTVTAKWAESFTVKFYNALDRVIKTQTVSYGKSATAPSAPSKARDDEYTYTFAGWDTDFSSVKSDLHVRPTYTETLRMYTVYLEYDENATGTMPTSVKTSYSALLTDVLPSTGFKNGDRLFDAWFDGDERIDDETYADLSSSTLTAGWKADPAVLEETKEVRTQMSNIVSEIDNATGFTREQEDALKPVRDAIYKAYNDALLGIRVDKEYVIKTYSSDITLASQRYNALSDKALFRTAIGSNLTLDTVNYLIWFFDVDIEQYK